MGLQSGNTVKPKTTRPVSETRKIRKPLMERKRRERINTSLNDLAALLTEANLVKGETGKQSKLEKADILELTVKHLKELKDAKNKGATCNASTSSGAGKGGTEATVPDEVCDSCEDTSSDNASSQHNKLCEEKQKVENIVNEAISDDKQDKRACATCSLPREGSVKFSSNVSENISSQDEKSASLSEEKKNSNSSSSAPSSSKGSVNTENYVLGFKKCMSAIENIMAVKQDHENCHQENIRPKLLNHLKNFLKSIDIDLKTSVTAPIKSFDELLSISGTESSSKAADVSSTTSEGDQSNNLSMSNLTLVPTRLPGGNLAFVVQGGADATVLLQSAEMMLQNPETKEEKFAQKRPTAGKGMIKSEDILQSDNVIKTRKKEEIRVVKVESGNYSSQTQNKETSPKQFLSQLPNKPQVFKPNTVTNVNFTVQSTSTSIRATTPAKPSPKVSQTPSESSPESKSHDQYNFQFASQTPTVRPNTLKSLSSPLPSTSREHFINKPALHVSCATTTVDPSQPVDKSSSQLVRTSSPQQNETGTIPSASLTFAVNNTHNESRIAFTPVKENPSFHVHLPVTPQTPNSEHCSQLIQPSSLTSPLSMLCPNSFVLSTPTASTSSHALYTDQPQFLTPPPTPIEHASLRKASVNMYQEESESLIVYNPLIPQHSNASTSSQAILRPPKSSVLNVYDGRAKTMEEKNAQERLDDRDNDENPFMVEERRNHQDNELPFDLSLRRMWRPW